MNWTMTSRWGAQIEGESYDILNLYNKLNGSILGPSSFFVSMINDVSIFRSSQWDNAVSHSDAYQLAVGDLALVQGCLNVLDGCLPLGLGTVYEFVDGNFNMARETPIEIIARKPPEELTSPEDYRAVFTKVESHKDLRQAFVDLIPSAPWIDIYRSWESLKSFYGGEHKVYKRFPGEKQKIENLKRTANSFRHVKAYDVVPNPMPREDAVAYLKDLLVRTAHARPQPAIADQAFQAGQQVNITNMECDPGQPVSLNRLSLGPPAVEPD